jgi:valyl-tRNA synthetase
MTTIMPFEAIDAQKPFHSMSAVKFHLDAPLLEDHQEKKTVQSDFFEIASSCKETDYSLNTQHKDLPMARRLQKLQELTGKQIQRMRMEDTRKSITRNLKEENDRA